MNTYELMARIINERIHRKYVIDGMELKSRCRKVVNLLFA